MNYEFTGRIWKLPDDVDTDTIIPGRYGVLPDVQAMSRHCLEPLRPELASKARPGDIFVAGKNFGCGSSREHAPMAIQASGAACVIAASFARIFYRNAINIGFPILECPAAAEAIQNGDTVSVDFSTGVIVDETTGKTYQAAAFPPFIEEIIRHGGLLPYLKARQDG